MDPDGLLLGVVLARLWRPWARSAAVGMIWKTDDSVVVLGADPDGGDGDLSAGVDPDGLLLGVVLCAFLAAATEI